MILTEAIILARSLSYNTRLYRPDGSQLIIYPNQPRPVISYDTFSPEGINMDDWGIEPL